MASALTHFTYNTPVGHITIASNGTAITEIAFGVRTLAGEKRATELTNRAANQLQEYFAGKRRTFDLPLAPAGTDFQKRVWTALKDIPYGQTCSYSDIAAAIGNPKGCQQQKPPSHRRSLPSRRRSKRCAGRLWWRREDKNISARS